MGSKKISELPYIGSPNITGLTAVVIEGVTYHTTLDDIKTLFGIPVSYTGTTLYSTTPLAGSGFTLVDGVFIGLDSGFEASNAYGGIFIGSGSGYQAQNADNSVFIGNQTGWLASNANSSNFIGHNSGYNATDSNYSNFLGNESGNGATDAHNSNFFGDNAGNGATNAHYSNFIGASTGLNAINSSGSVFIGHAAGFLQPNSAYSILLGHFVGTNFFGTNELGKNNIIIGNSISLDGGRENSLNIGGVIFGSGLFSPGIDDIEFTGSVEDGRIGINQPYPNYNFDISGSFGVSENSHFTGSMNIKGVIEKIEISSDSNNKNFDFKSGSIFYVTDLTDNGTWNVNNIPIDNGFVVTMTFITIQGSTPYSSSQYQINGDNISIKWLDSMIPSGSSNKTDVISLSAFRVNSSWDVYGSLLSFG